MSTEFAGRLLTFVDDDENVNEPCMVELADFTKDGHIELKFHDRNEDCYLKFRLQDLMRAIAEENGSAVEA